MPEYYNREYYNRVPLLQVPLTRECFVAIFIDGKITLQAIKRLQSYLELTLANLEEDAKTEAEKMQAKEEPTQ